MKIQACKEEPTVARVAVKRSGKMVDIYDAKPSNKHESAESWKAHMFTVHAEHIAKRDARRAELKLLAPDDLQNKPKKDKKKKKNKTKSPREPKQTSAAYGLTSFNCPTKNPIIYGKL